jgi:hypothetical protein
MFINGNKDSYTGDLMEINSTVGICTKINGTEGKLVIIPQDDELFEENEVVVLLSANEFESFSDEIKSFINLVKSAQSVKKE